MKAYLVVYYYAIKWKTKIYDQESDMLVYADSFEEAVEKLKAHYPERDFLKFFNQTIE